MNPYTWIDLVLADGRRLHYVRTSSGTGYANAVYEHTASPTEYYKSRIAWNATRQGWDLTTKRGVVYEFPFADGAAYGEQAAVQKIRDRYGNTLTFSRGGAGILTRISGPNGRFIDLTYDSAYRVTLARDNIGRVVTYLYDADGRLAKVTNAAGGVTEYTYDTAHRMLTLKDARQIVFLTNAYDAAGRVTLQTQIDSTTYQFAYTVDSATGKISQVDLTDPRGNVRRVAFNGSGFAVSDTAAFGTPIAQLTSYMRDTANRITSVTDALGRRTDIAYDSVGNVQSVTRLAGTPNAATTSYTYEANFNGVATITDPLQHTTSLIYDAQGNVTTITNPALEPATMTYNSAGQPLTFTIMAATTTLAYSAGEPISVKDPLENITTRVFDAAGRLVNVKTPLGQRTRYEYDALDRLLTIKDALGGLTRFGYDPNGNVLSVTDARNNGTTYVYNNMDRLQTRTDPLLRSESYTYNNNGSLATFTDRKSQATHSTYDELDRLTQRTYADTSTTTYTWDAGNRLTQIADSISGTITRTYDGLDRLTSETTPEGSVGYTYDAAGRRTSMTVAGQPTVTYGYDDANRLTSVTQGPALVTMAYDTAGRRTLLALPNGSSTEYSYDLASRLTGLTYKNGTVTLGALEYAYDADGNRRLVGGTWARTGLPGSLESANYNAANQQLSFGSRELTYDLNGNLTNDGLSLYTWNARNQLVAISGAMVASFGYDGIGRRRSKSVNGTSTSFLYDGVSPAQEQSGSSVANLLTGLAVDEFYARSDSAGVRYYFSDALGSTIALSDSAGAVQSTYTYEAFGTTTLAGAASSSYTFTGREDDGTGLKYYRARYYHPLLQRFISEDPIGFWGGDLNLYSYVANTPVNYVDPSGLTIIYGRPPFFRPGQPGTRSPAQRYNAPTRSMRDTPHDRPLKPGAPSPSGGDLIDKMPDRQFEHVPRAGERAPMDGPNLPCAHGCGGGGAHGWVPPHNSPNSPSKGSGGGGRKDPPSPDWPSPNGPSPDDPVCPVGMPPEGCPRNA